MPKIAVEQLARSLRVPPLADCYLFVGSEAFLRRGSIQEVMSALQRNCSGELDVIRFDAAAKHADEVVEQLRGDCLFAQHKVVLVGALEKWKTQDLALVAKYMASPSPNSTLLLAGEKLDQRTKAAKQITSKAVLIECRPLYPRQIPGWINIATSRKGKHIAQDAASCLAELVGNNLGELDQALEKLCLFVGNRKLIEITDVEQVIMETNVRDVFSLSKAVGEGDTASAISVMERLLGGGENAVRISGMLARHWRLLSRTHDWLANHPNADSRALAGFLKVHPFFIKEYVSQARRFDKTRLKNGFNVLTNNDQALKRSRCAPRSILTASIMELTSKTGGR